ncbi:MAG: twin-arginine translocase subunit TatC [Halobacteria archaeon]
MAQDGIESGGVADQEEIYRGIIAVASSARQHLVKILSVFIIGLLVTVIFLRVYAFDAIKHQTLSRAARAGYEVQTSFINPFEVILLQAKIGLVVGLLFTFPMLLYYGREPLERRGVWPDHALKNRHVVLVLISAVVLFFGGLLYAYYVMVPLILQFVSGIAVAAGIKPFFRISKFIGFVLMYTALFGFMAELPLLMTFAVKSGMASYRFFRTKWRYFVIGAAILSAVVTSPDPMTQVVVLGPLITIYFLGLGVLRLIAREEIKIEKKRQARREAELVKPKDQEQEKKAEEQKGAESQEPVGDVDQKVSEGHKAAEPEALQDRGLMDVATAVGRSLRSHIYKLGAIFLVVTGVAFWWLVYHGVRIVKNQMLIYMPERLARQVSTVQLRIFEVVFMVVKYSTIAGLVAITPLALYYSREALVEEGVISGDAGKFYYLSRAVVIVGLFLAGAAYSLFGMTPVLISILSNSIVESQMVASFSISRLVNFVFLITVITGVMAEMPAAMYFLVSSRVVTYEMLKDKWRHFTILTFVIGAVTTSPDPFTMLVVAAPLSGFYLISLGITRVLCHGTIKSQREDRHIGLANDGGNQPERE